MTIETLGSAKTQWIATPGSTGASPVAPSLTVNGNAFFAQGVCYQPIPWGASANWPPFGNFMSSPWHEIWERDLPIMRNGGVNLLRTYNMPCEQQGVEYDHTDFLNACWNNGNNPIYVLLGFGDLNNLAIYDPWKSNAAARTSAEKVFLKTVEKYKDFPAVMGFIIANEVNTSDTIANSEFWKWLNKLCIQAKENAPDKITVMSLVDDSMNSVTTCGKQMPDLDVWGINSYRGQINPANANNFDNLWSSFHSVSNKPLLITEWGAPASTHDVSGALSFSETVANDLNTYITGHYLDFVWNAVSTTTNGSGANPNSANWAPVCIGSCYFEWSDELWKLDATSGKTCQATVQNAGISQNAAFPGGWDDEECFGLNSITPVKSDNTSPADRPGPNSSACKGGPWNFALGQPYAADVLTPRPSWATLSSLFGLAMEGSIVDAFGSAGNWQATFYVGSPIPVDIVSGMHVIGTGIPVGTTVSPNTFPSDGEPLVTMSIVMINNNTESSNPFTVSSTPFQLNFVS